MELSYWRSKWKKGKTGFHMDGGYPGLEKHWPSLQLSSQAIVFVPLCGKTKDLLFLSEQCSKVIGVEISEIAIHQFLTENNLKARSSSFAEFTIYQTKNIQLWNGDFFKLPKHKLAPFDLIYDKAALIALPPEIRKQYAKKILSFSSEHTQILLHLFEYNQEEMNGPPFSVSIREIEERFGEKFVLKILEKKELNINNYKKFENRGLQSHFIEILSLLLPTEDG